MIIHSPRIYNILTIFLKYVKIFDIKSIKNRLCYTGGNETMRKKNPNKKRKKKAKRVIRCIITPLVHGTYNTIELVLICLIISVFRLIFTGSTILFKQHFIPAMLLIFGLLSVLEAEVHIIKKESFYDLLFIATNKIIKVALYLVSIIIVVLV